MSSEGNMNNKKSPIEFSDVFKEYQKPIYNYLLRMTQNKSEAEDLTQETFIKVNQSLSKFRGDSSLSTWLYRIATNTSHDYFRKKTVQKSKDSLSIEESETGNEKAIYDEFSSTENLAAQSEMSTCVQDFILSLKTDYRSVLVLHDMQGLKNREIADVLNCTLDTVKIRLYRARKELQKTLKAG